MDDITSAGTLVAAVLKTAGLLTQARLLQDFHNFFMAGGGLIWIIAGIGGLMSIVVFGSFRAARYLLVGPALYWTLIGPTTPVQGVMWKLGGGEARTNSGTASPAESARYIREVVGRTNPDGKDMNVPVEASTTFLWFTSIIDNFVNTAVDVVLKHENDKDLLFISKTQALEYLVSAKLTNPEAITIFEDDLYVKCRNMMNASLASSNLGLSERNEEQWRLSAQTAQGSYKNALLQEADRVKYLRDTYRKQYNDFSNVQINPGNSTVKYMTRVQDQPNSAVQKFMSRKYPGKKVEDLGSSMSMSCGDLWGITQQVFYDEALKLDENLAKKFKGEATDPEVAKQLLCSSLQEKLGKVDAPDGNCNLVEAGFIYLLRNSLREDAMARMVEKHRNNFQGYKTLESGTMVTYGADGKTEVVDRDLATAEITREGGELKVATGEGDKRSKKSFVRLNLPAYGHVDAAFHDHLRYQTRELRQKIFTWAMNIPYWQGTILYLITIAYPFLALVVLIPGRAQAFVNVPLAWLWIQSWDIGFAVVRVFEKIIWNLFPHQDLPLSPNQQIDTLLGGNASGGTASTMALPDVLQEAFKVDPLYNVHSYYYLLSLALLSVPSITGYATIKAKRSILSSFTDGPKQDVKAAGDTAGNQYGQNMMSQRLQQSYAMNAAAYNAQGSAGSGINGAGRSGESSAWAAAAAATNLMAEGNGGSAVKSTANAASAGLDTYQGMLGQKVNNDAARESVFGGTVGRWSPPRVSLESNACAMDGGGTCELNDADGYKGQLASDRSLAMARVDNAIDMLTSVGKRGVSLATGPQTDLSKGGVSAKDVILSTAVGSIGAYHVGNWAAEAHGPEAARGPIEAANEKTKNAVQSSFKPVQDLLGGTGNPNTPGTNLTTSLFNYGIEKISPPDPPTYDASKEVTRR